MLQATLVYPCGCRSSLGETVLCKRAQTLRDGANRAFRKANHGRARWDAYTHAMTAYIAHFRGVGRIRAEAVHPTPTPEAAHA